MEVDAIDGNRRGFTHCREGRKSNFYVHVVQVNDNPEDGDYHRNSPMTWTPPTRPINHHLATS